MVAVSQGEDFAGDARHSAEQASNDRFQPRAALRGTIVYYGLYYFLGLAFCFVRAAPLDGLAIGCGLIADSRSRIPQGL